MFDLVLQDSRIPSRGLNDLRRSGVVETFDAHSAGTWDDRRISGQAKTAFEKLRILRKTPHQPPTLNAAPGLRSRGREPAVALARRSARRRSLQNTLVYLRSPPVVEPFRLAAQPDLPRARRSWSRACAG